MGKGRLQHASDHYRTALRNHERQAEQALEDAYRSVLKMLEPALDRLYQQMADKLAEGDKIPLHWLMEAGRLENIKKLIQHQIDHFGRLSHAQVLAAQHYAVQLGQQSAMEMLHATVPPGFSYNFGIPSTKAIQELVGVTQAGSPLADLFDGFGREAAQKAGEALITGVTLGRNPRQVAGEVQQALGISRNRALTISRDQLNNAYRNANLETYRANDDVVDNWIWSAAMDARTCFPPGTQIQTRRGRVPIEQIKIGDEVLTHKGRYKRVYDTLQRPYSGEMVTVISEERSIIATGSHPFLIEREGELDWIEAGQIRLGDRAICYPNSVMDIANHALSQHSIKGGIGQSDNRVPSALQKKRFAGITFCHAGLAMPINTVYFDDDIQIMQEKINRRSPALDAMLLHVSDPQRFQAETGVLFGFGFSCKTPITAIRAEASPDRLKWSCAKLLAAIQASINDWWSAAFLRTVVTVGGITKNFAASFARMQDIFTYLIFLASHARVGAIYPPVLAREYSKILSANNACFADLGMYFPAFQTAKILISAVRKLEKLTTIFASAFGCGHGYLPSSRVGVLGLENGIAFPRTETPVSFALPGFGNSELFTALPTSHIDSFGSISRPPRIAAFGPTINMFLLPEVADIDPSIFAAHHAGTFDSSSVERISLDIKFFHKSIVSQHDKHVQSDTTVYNLEVEDDHSYVANGFVVHNCAVCVAMNGTVHPLSESLDGHVGDRCVPLPQTKSWEDILGPLGVDTSEIPDTTVQVQDGSDWFAQQDAATQQSILGSKAAYDLYKSGTPLSAFVGVSHDPDWGRSRYQKSAKQVAKASK